jgi:hypothetical protein
LQRESRSVVEFYRAKLTASDDVRSAIGQDATISEPVRDQARAWIELKSTRSEK